MKKLILIVATAITLTSCHKKAVSSEKVSDVELQLLFEKDGCKMYRFLDGDDYVYWSTCEGRTQYTDKHTSKIGKTTHTSERKIEAITSSY